MLGCDTLSNTFVWLVPCIALLMIHFRYMLGEYLVENKTRLNYALMGSHAVIIVGLFVWVVLARERFCS